MPIPPITGKHGPGLYVPHPRPADSEAPRPGAHGSVAPAAAPAPAPAAPSSQAVHGTIHLRPYVAGSGGGGVRRS